ncbi:MAG: hypothetical protein JRN20_09795 [Nitrososphaerota archaeon]|nr:hypothetical protein [Nitrososphaerota archaeon]
MKARSDMGYFARVQVVALILFQVAAAVFLWRLNPVTTNGTALFAIFLSAEMLSFALISHIYRQSKREAEMSSKWLIVGYVVLGLLIVASFLPGR